MARVLAAGECSDEALSALLDSLDTLEYVNSLTGAGVLHTRTLDEEFAGLQDMLTFSYLSEVDHCMALESFDGLNAFC